MKNQNQTQTLIEDINNAPRAMSLTRDMFLKLGIL